MYRNALQHTFLVSSSQKPYWRRRQPTTEKETPKSAETSPYYTNARISDIDRTCMYISSGERAQLFKMGLLFKSGLGIVGIISCVKWPISSLGFKRGYTMDYHHHVVIILLDTFTPKLTGKKTFLLLLKNKIKRCDLHFFSAWPKLTEPTYWRKI